MSFITIINCTSISTGASVTVIDIRPTVATVIGVTLQFHSFRYCNIDTHMVVIGVVSIICIKVTTVILIYIIVRPSRHYFYYLLLVSTTIWPAFTFIPTPL